MKRKTKRCELGISKTQTVLLMLGIYYYLPVDFKDCEVDWHLFRKRKFHIYSHNIYKESHNE